MFPILGGRLLKEIIEIVFDDGNVSNPWREAIEETRWRNTTNIGNMFPILGGRLLKKGFVYCYITIGGVSNPWREAIEGTEKDLQRWTWNVSNPWREAIEGSWFRGNPGLATEFPILGGRLLKR